MRKPNARERILETAAKLFFKKGYSEVGINEIIDQAETAKASFYQHFPSKEALCEAWLSSVHDRSEQSRSDLLASDLSPEQKLQTYFDQLESFMRQSEFRGCPYSNTSAVTGSGCTGILEQIRDHKESIRDFFRSVCLEKFGSEERASHVGDQLFVLYSGATTESQNLKEIWPVHEARDAALSMIRG